MVDGMDGGIICVSTYKYASRLESKGSHIIISIDSWEYTGNGSSVWKEEIRRFKIFKKALCIDAKNKGGYDKAHEIK